MIPVFSKDSAMIERTHSCGALRPEHVGQNVSLCGWVQSYRDHGGVVFIDLRDREGLTQVVFHPEHREAHELADRLRSEDVVQVGGPCVRREPGMANAKLATGEVEVQGQKLVILNKAVTPPFTPDNAEQVGEETRLKYRYIDLRSPRMQGILRTRHRVTKIMRDYFDAHGFYEVETPFLCKSTPEGARDFLVPSRLQAGSFYALPQSPQLFKQILMVAGLERYVQIVRCFRDEDPRADRQAEFTQLDMEMSFVDQEDIMKLVESLMRRVWKEILNVEVPPIPRMTYAEAMSRFGSDRPDLRFGMELKDLADLAAKTDFGVFKSALGSGGMVKAIVVPGGAALTRKETDGLADWAKGMGAKGLAVTKVGANGQLETGIAKFLAPIAAELIARLGAKPGDLLCFAADSAKIVYKVLGELRLKMARERGMIPEGQWAWVWIVDFPSFEWNADEKRWDALHHPFTAPRDEDLAKLESDPGTVIAKAYDIVCNGSELGGGSIRIHRSDVQAKVFGLLGINEQWAKIKFGFLLDALKYGAPPHGGLALGLDRIIMHLCGTTNIRDVIAFPKTQNGADLMSEAPSPVEDKQLRELHLKVVLPPKAPPAPPAAPAGA
jgi:aspartyl-tRNA synthetase